MTKPKKKLSKNAKAVLKVLEDSKLLKDSKTANASKLPQNSSSSSSATKKSVPNKMRPEKKRG